METQIITHRGLEPEKEGFYNESTYEAFENHLSRGFGIEFDINFTKDNEIIIIHDSNLTRITSGKDNRKLKNLHSNEITKLELEDGRLCFFDELMDLIRKHKTTISALHFKGIYQNKKHLDILIESLNRNSDLLGRILIFDIKPNIAKKLLMKLPNLILAPSVAHPFDIKRYNNAVCGTLISIREAIEHKNLYKWVWLDEWDLKDENSNTKSLYNKETFNKLRKSGYKIALVTPELHGTSPGLLGGESHPDAKSKERLFLRIGKIIELEPNAICTDYPSQIRSL